MDEPPVPTREIVVLAHALMRIQAAIEHGFVTAGAEINVERLEDVIAFGQEQGWRIGDAEITECAMDYVAQYNLEVEDSGVS